MDNNTIPFAELMNVVINQLKSWKYMDSTLIIYRRIYKRIQALLAAHGTDVYTHELGKAFIDASNVCKSTLSSYICAVRRLDDYIDGKPYRCHHDDPKFEAPPEFSDILTEYLHECEQSGNKTPTVLSKERTCVSFLNQVALNGCLDLSKLDAGIITRALLVFSNKDNYARVRQFLQYLAVEGITEVDFSGIVPHYKRTIPLPTVYSPEEIYQMEASIDTSTTTGKRNLAIIRLASRMGLRAGDITALKLSEIDFSGGYITIIQEKTNVPLSLIMPSEVSESLTVHLENDIYSLEDGYVFHSMTAPYGRITTSIIRHVLNECLHNANINIAGRKHGSHALRSSLASSMVNDGASYEVVRRILGHTDPNVIKRYAKADIENLRLCAIDPPPASGLFLEYLSGKEVICHV